MKVKHLNFGGPINFIEVRNYSNVIVNVSQSLKPDNSEFCSGFWRVKHVDKVPIEYKNDYVFLKKYLKL
jgi:hypothetical protein